MMEDQLNGVANCPHCGVAHPHLRKVWGENTLRSDGRNIVFWAAYCCMSCGGLVTAEGHGPNAETRVRHVYPSNYIAEGSIPERARLYLQQSYQTLANPDASVVMSASAIDAMLKDKGLEDGSLYRRIDQAVEQGIITQVMSEWAHRVRLDANNPRHADAGNPHMSADDARRAFKFAKALGDFLYVLPSEMPEEQEAEAGE